MRTTINIDDEVLRVIRSLAHDSGDSVGTVVSRLLRQALRPPERVAYKSDCPVFEVRAGTAPITPEMVASGLQEA